MAEMCPAHIRGSLVTSKEAFIVLGIIVGYTSGNALSFDPRVWYGELSLVSQNGVKKPIESLSD